MYAREVRPTVAVPLMVFRRSMLGPVAAMGVCLLGGSTIALTRMAVQSIDPLLLAGLRYLIGAAFLLPFALRARGFKIAPQDRLPLLALSVIFFSVFPLSFSVALRSITASRGALVLSTVPVLTLFLSRLMGYDRLTRTNLLGVAIALGGIAVALGNDAGNVGRHGLHAGDLLMFGTAVCGAVYNVFSQPYLRTYPSLPMTAWAMFAGVFTLLVPAVVTGGLAGVSHLTLQAWLVVGFLGVVGTGMAFSLLSVALEAITPARVAIFITLNPLVAVGLSVVLLGEPVTGQFALGLGCVLTGIGLVNWNTGDRRPAGRPSPSTVTRPYQMLEQEYRKDDPKRRRGEES